MNEEYYIQLIQKQLGQEASPQEIEELQTWLEESPAHQERYEEERLLWDLSAQPIAEEDLEVDLEAEFNILQARINADEAPQIQEEESPVIPLSRKTSNWRFWQIAASITLLIAVGALVRFGLNGEDLITIEASESQLVTLPDGSSVRLKGGSTLAYPAEFATDQRLVTLEGEAFFEVESNPEQAFIIQTSQEQVRVVGTAFNLRAPANSEESQVYVVEGIVEFGPLRGDGIRLTARDLGTFDRRQGTVEKKIDQNANATAWFSEELSFTNSSLLEVIHELEYLHAVKIDFDQGLLADCRFTGSFVNQDLQGSLEVLSLVFELEIINQGDQGFLLKGKGCK